jgi:hypothetical protein
VDQMPHDLESVSLRRDLNMGNNNNEIHVNVVHHSDDIRLNEPMLRAYCVNKPYQKVCCDRGLFQEACHGRVDSEAQ